MEENRVADDRTAWRKEMLLEQLMSELTIKCVPVETWVRYAMCFDSPFSRTSSDLRKLFV